MLGDLLPALNEILWSLMGNSFFFVKLKRIQIVSHYSGGRLHHSSSSSSNFHFTLSTHTHHINVFRPELLSKKNFFKKNHQHRRLNIA